VKVIAAELLTSAASPEGFPREGLPEIAFLGRSNVGKSSLLNRLAARRGLARTSSTPGKTRLLHFFRLVVRDDDAPDATRDRTLLFVDLPGYGYAKVSQAERAEWKSLVEAYLSKRPPLRAAVLLQDLRRDVDEDETLLLAWLAQRGVPALVALTKADKLPPMQRARRVRELGRALPVPADRVFTTSAEKGLGIAELWEALRAQL
jgi:GTP-binding protein